MAVFNLNGVTGSSTAQPKLAPWQIHDVEFKGIEYSKFAGHKDPNAEYQVMRVKFANKDGIFEETRFCPKDGDEVRPKNGDRESPSSFENFMFFIAQLGEKLCPERYEKFKGRAYDLPKDFERMIKDLNEVLKPAIGKIFKLKLIANKKGEPVLPYFVNINKEGKAYASNNFIGQNVFFTPYELETKKKREEAKPTEMEGSAGDGLDTPAIEEEKSSENDSLNFDV